MMATSSKIFMIATSKKDVHVIATGNKIYIMQASILI